MGKNTYTEKCPACGAVLPDADGANVVYCEYCGSKVVLWEEPKPDPEEELRRREREEERKREKRRREMEEDPDWQEYKREKERQRREEEQRREEQRRREEEEAEKRRLERKKEEEKLRRAEEHKRHKRIVVGIGVGIIIIGILVALIGYAADSENAAIIGSFIAIGGFFVITIGLSVLDDKKDIMDGKIKLPDISNYEEMTCFAAESELRKAGFTNIQGVPLRDLVTGLLNKPNTVKSISVDGEDINNVSGKRHMPDVPIIIYFHSFK